MGWMAAVDFELVVKYCEGKLHELEDPSIDLDRSYVKGMEDAYKNVIAEFRGR